MHVICSCWIWFDAESQFQPDCDPNSNSFETVESLSP